MFDWVKKLLGSSNDVEVKKLQKTVNAVEALEDEYKALTDEQLRAKTDEFRARLQNGETEDDILPEAFAAIREADARVLGMRPYRVQVMGGLVLHQGRIAEMKTGEGKTLVSTLPAYLNALSGKGVHVVTVNDYLARRDSEWMGKVHRFMGLSVGLIVHDLDSAERRAAYACDITYGTNNELGFDYLRDNMVIRQSELVQRGHNFAIVDEVDSILIDEARTPLIISGAGDKSTDLYEKADRFVCTLQRGEEPEQDRWEENPLSDEELASGDFSKALAWWDECIAAHKAAGAEYIVVPSMRKISTLKDLQTYCRYFNEVGARCAAAGMKFGYHNHSREFEKIEDKVMLDYMLENTDPDKVLFEMDVYWTVMGKASPVDYFKKYPGRFIIR